MNLSQIARRLDRLEQSLVPRGPKLCVFQHVFEETGEKRPSDAEIEAEVTEAIRTRAIRDASDVLRFVNIYDAAASQATIQR